MKKVISVLFALLYLTIFSSVSAETAGEVLPDISMPVNEPLENWEGVGGEGTVHLAEIPTELPDASISVEAYIPEELDKVIIGTDNRIQVKSPGQYPYSTIAYMEVQGSCDCIWKCSGFMVGKNCLLTAAHCVICSKHGKWAKDIIFYFGFKSKSNYLYKYNGGWFARAGTDFPNHVYDSVAMDDDWAYIILNENIGEKTGCLGFNFASDTDIRNRIYMASGYRDGKLKYGWGDAYANSEKLMCYFADDVPGNSGGPIFMANYQADAIIAAEDNVQQINYGRRITPDIWLSMKLDGYQ